MKVLAVDTSCITASAAVLEDENVLAEYSTNHKKTHSQKLLPMINEMINDLELDMSEIDLFAAAVGPGSFTGLRIGVVTIKGFAYVLGKPVASIPTLDSMAYLIPKTDYLICPMLDARNRQIYTALYRWNNEEQERLTEFRGIVVDELVEEIKVMESKCIFLGDAAMMHKEYIIRLLGDEAVFADPAISYNRAAGVAALALMQYRKKNILTPFELEPFYLRKSQAERLKDKIKEPVII